MSHELEIPNGVSEAGGEGFHPQPGCLRILLRPVRGKVFLNPERRIAQLTARRL